MLVRRHGVYVWGSDWQAAKTQAECYHYLFDAAVRMRAIGVDPAAKPAAVTTGIGADAAYGSAGEGRGGKQVAAPVDAHHSHADGCCGSSGDGAGFHGAGGANAVVVSPAALQAAASAVSRTQRGDTPPITAVLWDIEGVLTSLAFVSHTLFPYAAKALRAHLTATWASPETGGVIDALVALSVSEGVGMPLIPPIHGWTALQSCPPSEVAPRLAEVAQYVESLMAGDRKVGPLKVLQGHIWRDGYARGELVGEVWADGVAALRAVVASGRRNYIYSSGSREAQRLLFAHSSSGDLRHLLSGYFDTTVGPKKEASSYVDIAATLGVDTPANILFVSDAMAECVAASAAGCVVVAADMPGNLPLPPGHPFRVVSALTPLIAGLAATGKV